MSEQYEDDESQELPQSEPDMMGLLKKMQQQLVFLEKKIDTLIRQSDRPPFRGGQSSDRPYRGGPSSDRPYRGGQYSKPSRSFGHSYHQAEGNRDFGNREGNFAPPARRFDRPRDGESRGGYGPRKKPFFQRRKERS